MSTEQKNCACPEGRFQDHVRRSGADRRHHDARAKEAGHRGASADGQLAIRESELKLIKDKYPLLGLPLVRGVVTFVASMVEGVKALMYSAEFFPEEEEEPEEPSKFELWLEKTLGSEKAASVIVMVRSAGHLHVYRLFSCCPPCW